MRSIAIAAIAAAAAVAHADTTDFFADINGDSEVPASGSPGVGTMTGVYDSVANTFAFSWTISGLLGAPAAPGAHIHMAPAGQNGPIVFGFNDADGSWDLSGSALWSGLSTDQVDALFAGNLYLNFHTDQFPGGEVRGQIGVVPAPGVAAVLGLGGVWASRRRR